MPLPCVLSPGTNCNLDEIPSYISDSEYDKASSKRRVKENAEVMADCARRLYAENRRSILLVLQGMDAAGKDGTIRTVMRGVNPRSCQVVSFKVPSDEEADHDFLWRIHKAVPRKGNIGIFNRSHYEDVLVVRVHELVPADVWQTRYEKIKAFEKILTESGTTILKCYLHISRDEQRERLQARVDNPSAHWKFKMRDLEERKLWPQYQEAYEDAITKCNTQYAPWHIIPSDRKWYRSLVVSELMRSTLETMDPQFPKSDTDFAGLVVE